MWGCATPATPARWKDGGWVCAKPARQKQNDGRCEVVPRLPRGIKVDVSLPCLPRRSGAASRASGAPKPSPSAPPSAISATPATQTDGRCEVLPRCHVKGRWMWVCATPATQKRGVTGVTRASTKSRRATQCHKCHACPAKGRQMWGCATPATWKNGGCEFVRKIQTQVGSKILST